MAGSYNLAIEQGATFKRDITWKDENGVVIDLTGASARMQIRKSPKSDVLLELTNLNGGIVLTPAQGRIQIIMTATQTGSFIVQTAVYDLEIAFTDGTVTRLLQGNVSFSAEVTR